MNPTAVVGRRVAAYVIDYVVELLVIAASWYALTTQFPGSCESGGLEIGDGCRGFDADHMANRTVWLVIVIAAPILLFWVLPAFTGMTPGKAAVGIRVIRRDGRAPGLGRILTRNVMYIVDGFPYVVPNLVGFVVALVDRAGHRRVGDRVAGTFVVHRSAAGRSDLLDRGPSRM